MKVDFFESVYGGNFDLIPETLEEASALARIALNSSAEPVQFKVYFSDSGPTASVWVQKVKESVQRNSIDRSSRKK